MARELKIGTKIDRIQKQRLKIDAINKTLSNEKAKLDDMEYDLIKHMQSEGLETSGGKLAKASIQDRTSYNIIDWPKFIAYIKRTNSFDMLQKRLSSTAVKERLDDKKKVPGIKPYTRHTITLRKV